MDVIVKNENPDNLPPSVDDDNMPMGDGNLLAANNNISSVDQQIPRKRLTKILNIKRIKERLNEEIGPYSVKFTDAAHRTQ